MADAEIEVDVIFGARAVKKQLDDIETTAKKSGDKAGTNYATGFTRGIRSGMASAGAAFAGFFAIREVARQTRGFSRAVAEVNSLLPNTERLSKNVTDQFIKLSSQFGGDAQTQVKAYYSIVSGGVEGTAKRLSVLRQANEAATAGLVDINTAAFALVSSVNAYSKSGLTATQASDSLFKAVKDGQTTFVELASSIGDVAPSASSVGVTFSEMSGALAFLTKGGVSTVRAATQLRAIFVSLVKPAEQSRKAAKELGLELSSKGIKAAGGFAKFMEKVKDATNGNNEALGRLFPNQRALIGIQSILKRDFRDFNKVLKSNKDSLGSTAIAAAKLKESLDFKIEVITSKIRNLALALSNKLAPQLVTITDFWTQAFSTSNANKAAEITKEIADMSKEVELLERNLRKNKDSALANFSIFGSSKNQDDLRAHSELLADITLKREELDAVQKRMREDALANGGKIPGIPTTDDADDTAVIVDRLTFDYKRMADGLKLAAQDMKHDRYDWRHCYSIRDIIYTARGCLLG
jgi:TP901 family phage tail tape measure protein